MTYKDLDHNIVDEEADSPIKITIVQSSKGKMLDIRHMYYDHYGALHHTKRGVRVPIVLGRQLMELGLTLMAPHIDALEE